MRLYNPFDIIDKRISWGEYGQDHDPYTLSCVIERLKTAAAQERENIRLDRMNPDAHSHAKVQKEGYLAALLNTLEALQKIK